MPTRRTFLAGLAGVCAAGVAGGTVFALTRDPAAARAPWSAPGTADDPRVRALQWAVLAPNPHNRQPWLVDLRGDNEAILYCDLDRRLPMTDPVDRQITIGLGCFVELFAMALAQEGQGVVVEPFPEGAPALTDRLDERPVARLTLTGRASPDPLFAAVPHRRTTREPYQDTPIPTEAMATVIAASRHGAAGTRDAVAVAKWQDLCRRAWDIESHTPRVHQESVDLMRIGKNEIEANPDGIALGGAMLDVLHLAGVVTRENLADPTSMAFAQGQSLYADSIGASKGFVWQVTPDNERTTQFEAGRDWLRINLAATAAGLAIQPLSQALQEYDEQAALLGEAHRLAGAEGRERVQMLARIGYGPELPPSPRWPAETRLL